MLTRRRKYSPHISERIFSERTLTPYEKTKRYQESNRPQYLETKRKASNRRTKNLKTQMIAAYGGYCICCGEDQYEFLSIDHRTPEAKKRDAETLSAPFGAGLYAHLRRLGWPKDDYQLLCMNCNFAKGKYGVCPHQTRTEGLLHVD